MSRKITAHTFVGDFGWTVKAFSIEGAEGDFTAVTPECFELRGDYVDIMNHTRSKGVRRVSVGNGIVTIEVDPFKYAPRDGFIVIGRGAAAPLSFTKDEIDAETIDTVDDFAAIEENGIHYRLWIPKESGARPLWLFLHGGGEGGEDNLKQMVGTLGAASLAERYPDMYVMAPQAPDGGLPPMNPNGQTGTITPGTQKPNTGWYDGYLLRIAASIERLIAEGKVDASRVYVTGLSMGGGGTLRMLGLRRDLFAAAAPICPTMTEETLAYLKGFGDFKLWITASYIDHTPIRHLRIVDGIRTLNRGGNADARYTLFSADELAEYGIAVYPDLTEPELLGENHNCWTLTYHNEYGVLDWVTAQSKQN